jgi:hypothetical protein
MFRRKNRRKQKARHGKKKGLYAFWELQLST